jgi:hypothetical protein
MKIAILLAGPYRGNDAMLLTHLIRVGSYDTYVSCFEHYKLEWLESKWPIEKLTITPSIDLKTTKWYEHRNDSAGQSGFWQFWNLKSVIESVTDDYDFYIKSRSDLNFYEGKLSYKILSELEPNTFYCPEFYFDNQFWLGTDRINDQFFIGDKNVMKVIAEFPIGYYNDPSKMRAFQIEGNEMALKKWLEQNSINIKVINGIRYSKNHNGFASATGEGGIYQLEENK